MIRPSTTVPGIQDPQFAYPVYYRSFNKSYYHLSVWNGIRESGWLKYCQQGTAAQAGDHAKPDDHQVSYRDSR